MAGVSLSVFIERSRGQGIKGIDENTVKVTNHYFSHPLNKHLLSNHGRQSGWVRKEVSREVNGYFQRNQRIKRLETSGG